ncbi:MAG: hypothetical protein ACREX4_25345 [Gammaproteobacteria bacterium]
MRIQRRAEAPEMAFDSPIPYRSRQRFVIEECVGPVVVEMRCDGE